MVVTHVYYRPQVSIDLLWYSRPTGSSWRASTPSSGHLVPTRFSGKVEERNQRRHRHG